MFVDLSAFDAPADPSKPDAEQAKDVVPWTMTYTIDVLNRGRDDFAPFAMFFDHPDAAKAAPAVMQRDVVTELKLPKSKQLLTRPEAEKSKVEPEPEKKEEEKLPHIAMDQTFFPIEEGTRTVLKIKMPPPVYYKLVYTWGWRRHPPRAQALEADAILKELGGPECKHGGEVVKGKKLSQYEKDVFGDAPLCSDAAKESAISKISDLSPAKRMWKALKAARQDVDTASYHRASSRSSRATTLLDWKTHQPPAHPRRILGHGHECPEDRGRGGRGHEDRRPRLRRGPPQDQARPGHRLHAPVRQQHDLRRAQGWRLRGHSEVAGTPAGGGVGDLGDDLQRRLLPPRLHGRRLRGARGWENQFKATEPLGDRGAGSRSAGPTGPWSSRSPSGLPGPPGEPHDRREAESLQTHREAQTPLRAQPPAAALPIDQLHHGLAIFSLH
ncbi:MAG: hypothetical protein WKF75_14605 [Singulisphaera sp.]